MKTYRGEVEYYSQHVDEDRDGEVHPLHVLERLGALAHVDEENVGAENRRNDRSNTIESLREVDAQLRVLWRTAHSDCHSLANPPVHSLTTGVLTVRIRSRLQTAQTIPDNKSRRAKPAERAVHKTWPSQQRAGAEQKQTPDKHGLVSPVSEQPIRMAQRSKRVRAKVGCLQSGGACARDVELDLEVLVQRVDEAV